MFASCVPTLQPILLGGLLGEGRIGAAAMGYAATAEALGMALGAVASGAWLAPRRLQEIGAAALVVVLAANLLTMVLHGPSIILARGLSGLADGVLLWLLVGMGARAENSVRLFAIYITANTIGVFGLSLSLSTVVIPAFGSASSFGVLSAVALILLLLVRWAPSAYEDLPQAAATANPPLLGWVGLAAVVLQLAGFMAFWIYCIPLGAQAGIPAPSMRIIVSAATGVQILAGLTAIAFARTLTGMLVLPATAALALVAVLSTGVGGGVVTWAGSLLGFAFCWMFTPSFHMSFLFSADPSRRSAIFVGAAQLVGLAVGPLLASGVTSPSDLGPVRLVSVACFVGALVCAGLVLRSAPRAALAASRTGEGATA